MMLVLYNIKWVPFTTRESREGVKEGKYMIIMIVTHIHGKKSTDININLSGNDAKNNDYLSLSIPWRMYTIFVFFLCVCVLLSSVLSV